MAAIRCPSALFANEKNVPIVDSTPVNNETLPIPMDAIVASVKIEELDPDKNPTSVDRTMVGRVTAVLRTE